MEVSNQIKLIIQSMRPKQWIKNLFIFAAIVFSKNFLNFALLQKTFFVFVLFCLLTGSIYIINDLIDIKKDKIHPEKRKRPIASGKLNRQIAVIASLFFAMSSIGLIFYIDPKILSYCIIYFIIFILYSVYLKHLLIVDVFIIAIGFVLRILIGATVIGVMISHWLLICTMFLALFLGFCKRRNELIILTNNSHKHRKNLQDYNPYFLDQMISVTTASMIISYTLYTISPESIQNFGTDKLIYTIPFVLYGIFRYLYIVHQKNQGGSPTDIVLTDKPFIINIGLWIISCFLIIYKF